MSGPGLCWRGSQYVNRLAAGSHESNRLPLGVEVLGKKWFAQGRSAGAAARAVPAALAPHGPLPSGSRLITTVRWTSPCRARGFEFEQQKALDELAFKSSSEGHLTGLSTDMAKPF